LDFVIASSGFPMVVGCSGFMVDAALTQFPGWQHGDEV
jgi:hypothetical protein